MIKKILLTGGGTAGSVTPLLAIADEIRRLDPAVEFTFIGTASGPERMLAEAANISFHSINAGKLRRYWSWQNISDLGRIWAGYHQAQAIIRWWRPDVIISAGSYVAVPVITAGWRAGCRILLHQEDVRPGLANRMVTKMADVITVTFEKSLSDFPGKKVQFTGNPIRPGILAGSKQEAKKLFHLEDQAPVLLALGGGTGSQFINQLVSEAALSLIENWQIIHLSGSGKEFMTIHSPRYHQYDFLTWQMAHAFAAADVIVGRAGLGTISELAALSKPAVIIPMPGTHQEENAQLLAESQAAITVSQELLTTDEFIRHMRTLLEDERLRQQLSDNIHRLYRPEAGQRIAQLALHLASL